MAIISDIYNTAQYPCSLLLPSNESPCTYKVEANRIKLLNRSFDKSPYYANTS